MQNQDIMSLGSYQDIKEIKIVTLDVSQSASQPNLNQNDCRSPTRPNKFMKSLIISTDKKKQLSASEGRRKRHIPKTSIKLNSGDDQHGESSLFLQNNENKTGNVKVCIRVRPLNQREKAKCLDCIGVNSDSIGANTLTL